MDDAVIRESEYATFINCLETQVAVVRWKQKIELKIGASEAATKGKVSFSDVTAECPPGDGPKQQLADALSNVNTHRETSLNGRYKRQ